MAPFNPILIAALSLILATALAVHPAFADDDDDDDSKKDAPAPSPFGDISPAISADLNYITHIPPAERKILEDCSNRMTRKCGDEAVSGMLLKSNMSDECCTQLVRMGRKCHRHLTRLLIQYPDFRQNSGVIKETSDKVWSGCEDVAADPPASSD
ncbi:hypothetical protein Vadar_011154 [Vaccinium darrowii]|uniref:Uncharacterized protein n=1 Tax=Vaccinium darrowii TaxID=229202 RepID=A0ACB7Z5K0_9ERIC|nr:hypothetical protein Vadar_011154 [Vaccinium darrowii]